MKGQTVHQLWPSHPAAFTSRNARPKKANRLDPTRRSVLRRSRLAGAEATRASAELTSSSATVLLIARWSVDLRVYAPIYAHTHSCQLLPASPLRLAAQLTRRLPDQLPAWRFVWPHFRLSWITS